jgi:hypothetical protein
MIQRLVMIAIVGVLALVGGCSGAPDATQAPAEASAAENDGNTQKVTLAVSGMT